MNSLASYVFRVMQTKYFGFISASPLLTSYNSLPAPKYVKFARKLEYHNSTLIMLSQSVQNSLARVIAGHAVQHDTHSSGITAWLHWTTRECYRV